MYRTLLAVFAPTVLVFALAAGTSSDARADWVDDHSGHEHVGSWGENSSGYGSCFGDCGGNCSWYRCGHTSNCETHDYYTRKYGLWSSAALSTFGPAIRDWGACVTGRGKEWVGENVISKVTGAAKWLSRTVSKWN